MQEVISVAAANAQVERIERFQSLQAGRYWRAKHGIPEEGIPEAMVLLLQSIRYAEDLPHTVILRPHPSMIGKDVELKIPQDDGRVRIIWKELTEHRFLVKDFLEKFEFEPDHERVRAGEVKAVQGRIAQLQAQLLETQADPVRLAQLIDSRLKEEASKSKDETAEDDSLEAPSKETLPAHAETDPKLIALARGSLAEAIGTGVTAQLVGSLKAAAEREHRIATVKSNWIKEKTAEIAGTLQALTPYFEEQAAAALAQTEDVRDYVDKLMQGIGSLDLYVGKDVTVETIVEGKGAPSDIPLTLVQRKLLMDEELALWADVDEGFDFSKESLFFDALRKHPGLIRQIFPTERCVLVMATTARNIDYHEPWANAKKNEENKKVFLLVRNGENLYRIFSSVESHLGTAQLFPSEDDQARVFSGYDGRQVKFEDIAYTDKLTQHEKFALHYKRFLILLCGLDHRLRLFGEFYPGPASLDFVSLEFQTKYLHFLFDGGARSLGQDLKPLQEWICEKNAYLRTGSRVLVTWYQLMDEKTAPGACKASWASNGRRVINRSYHPEKECEVVTAFREGSDLCVEAKVSGYSHHTHADRTFNCKVNLSKFEESYDASLAFLCLDAVTAEEITRYLENRESRRDHIYYIRFFKRALQFLAKERAAEAATREALRKALEEGGIATGKEALGIIDQAVIAWRAAHSGVPLPPVSAEGSKAWTELLDQMHGIARGGRELEQEAAALAKSLGYEPLRLVLSGSAKPILYAAPAAAERDDRLESHAWAHRLTLERTKKALKVKARRWAMLPSVAASETTLKEWPQAKDWADKPTAFASFEEKERLLFATSSALERLAPFAGTMSPETFKKVFETWKSVRDRGNARSAYVHEPGFAIPFGLVRYGRNQRLRYLCVGSTRAHVLLYRLAPTEKDRQAVREAFRRPFQNKAHASEVFELEIEARSSFELLTTSPLLERQAQEGFFTDSRIECQHIDDRPDPDPRLGSWFEVWRAKRDDSDAVYVSESVRRKETVILDELLGIRLPEDYEPVTVTMTEPFEKENTNPTLKCWFDIYPLGLDPEDLGPEKGGHSSREFTALSPAQARKRITEEARKALIDGGKLLKASDLPETIQPPEGVERWYVTKGNPA